MAKKIQSSGFGESRLNMAPEGSFDRNRLLDCHIGGVLVSELPVQLQQGILYDNTDEGLAEKRQKIEAKGRLYTGPRIEFGKSDWDGEVDEFDDHVSERGAMARDPFRRVMDQHVPEGFSGKMLSRAATKVHGTRGYKVVLDERGDPIERGGMVLGVIPTEIRDRRKREALQRDRDQQQRPNTDFRAAEEQNFSRAGISLAVARKAKADGAGLQDDSPVAD